MRTRVMTAGIALHGVLLAGAVVPVWADDDLTALKAQVQQLQQELSGMQQVREELKAVHQELQALKAERDARQPAPSTPVNASVADRVATLEETDKAMQEEQDSLLTRLGRSVDLSVYASLEFDHPLGGAGFSEFDARNIDLLLDARPADRLRAYTQIRFSRLATMQTDSTTDGVNTDRQGNIEMHQGWMEYAINEYINPRAGIILVPFGKYNLETFDPFQELTSRVGPLHTGALPTTWSEAGAGITGAAALGEALGGIGLSDLTVDYQAYLVNGLTNELTDTSLRNARGSYDEDNNNNKAIVGRLGIQPVPNTDVGLSGYWGKYDNSGHDVGGFDLDGKVTLGPCDLLGEYALLDFQKGGIEAGSTRAVPKMRRGGYLEAHYRFWPGFLTSTFLGRKFKSPTLTSAVRYEQVDISDDGDDGFGPNKGRRWIFGLNYRPVPTWVYKLEYVAFSKSKTENTGIGNDDEILASVAAAF